MSTPHIHIFKPGTHTAMSGEALHFSESDLAATAQAYNPSLHEAPLVVGHPRHDDPAYGWVQKLVLGDDGLTAIPHQVDPAFAEMYAAGRFKKVSASFYRPDAPANPVPGVWYLRHVGFLGAQPPAVKGLRPAEFGEEEGLVTVEFGEAVPSSDMPSCPIPIPAPEDPAMPPEEVAALKARAEALEKELAALRAAQVQAAAEARHAANTAFAEKIAAEARIPADSIPLVVAALDFAQTPDAAGQTVAFGEGEAARPLHEALRAWLAALPPRVEFGELATRARAVESTGGEALHYAENVAPERIDMDKKIRAYMQEHKVDYVTAFHAIAYK